MPAIYSQTVRREIHTVTRDACKLIYTYRLCDRAIVSVCVIDVMGRMAPVKQTDRDDARWHLDNCVKDREARA